MKRFERLAYDMTQRARVAWFIGQYLASARRSRPVLRRIDWPSGLPKRQLILDDMRALFRRDRANIAAGIYHLPHDMVVSPVEVLRKSRLFFKDLDQVNARRLEGGTETPEAKDDPDLPAYFRQNFHFQTGGWLTEESAELYDYQVEVLFAGSGDAMRRQALVPLYHFLQRRRDEPPVRLLDVGCGTGKFLTFVLQSFPELEVAGVDLSQPYLDAAGRRTRRFGPVRYRQAAAEKLPFEDETFDVLTSVYLFHELPEEVRRAAAAEFARVLRPGGRLILVDTIQLGDHAPFDALLEAFPRSHHEPYYASYVREDLDALFADAGLETVGHDRAHLSKVSAFEKPPAAAAAAPDDDDAAVEAQGEGTPPAAGKRRRKAAAAAPNERASREAEDDRPAEAPTRRRAPRKPGGSA